MERMEILSTNKPAWPVIQKLVIASGAEVEKDNKDNFEWYFTVTGSDGSLSDLRNQLKEKTTQTICSGISTFYKLIFTHDGKDDETDLLEEIRQNFRVDIKVDHLSENSRHISIEDKKDVLEKIVAFLAQRKITASLF